jgi:hypothetical protein
MKGRSSLNSIDGVLEQFREDRPFILKLHGDISHRGSIVLGDRSYERLLYRASDYRDCLQSVISMASVLFVGFGGSDPDLDGLISKVAAFDGRRKRHWMVVPEGQFPPLKAKRLYLDKGIQVVQYTPDGDHSALVRFLEILARPA